MRGDRLGRVRGSILRRPRWTCTVRGHGTRGWVMSRSIRVAFDLVVRDGTDVEAFAERMFDALCADEMNLWGEIECVDGFDVEIPS